jgi:periplasmic divalent cation tolerance protein
MSAVLVMTTAGSRAEAEQIARTLVEERLAACVTIVPGAHSTYRWRDAVDTADELLLLIKTGESALEALKARIDELHSYELPEFLVLGPLRGSAAYLDWIAAGVG